MRAAVPVLAAAALAGCGTTSEKSWPINERWAVAQNASEACLSAARRASHYCVVLNSDPTATRACTTAQWDYERECKR